MVLVRLSISWVSVSMIVARLPCCADCAKGVTGLVGDSDGGGGSGSGFDRLFCRLKLRACCAGDGPGGLIGRGAETAGLSIVGTKGSDGRRITRWEGLRVSRPKSSLPDVIFLMPRKAEDRISEVLDGERSSLSESENRLGSLMSACCWPDLPHVSLDPDIVYA